MSAGKTKPFLTLGIYAFLFCITLLFLYPVLFSREASFCIFGDNLDMAFAFLNKLSVALHKGYFPIWDANTYGGKNFPGEFQTGIFYPLNIIWCFLFGTGKGIDVYYVDLLISLHYFICLTGMYKLARLFQMPVAAALGVALVFSFTGMLSEKSRLEAHIFYGLALLPWCIYFLCKYYAGVRKKKWLVFTGLTAGLQILAGHLQPFFHTMIIAVLFIVVYEYRSRKNWMAFSFSVISRLAILLLFTVIIAFPQLYYAFQYLSDAYRNVNGMYLGPTQKMPLEWFLHLYVLKPTDFENLAGEKTVIPDDYNYVYMGILPLFLCVLFLIKRRSLKLMDEHRILLKVLFFSFLIGLFTVMGYLGPFPYFLYAIPFVSTIRELSRYALLINFSNALLVGLALSYLSQLGELLFQQGSKLWQYAVGFLTLNALYWILFQQEHVAVNVSIPFLLGFLFVLLLMTVETNVYTKFLAIGFILFDLWLNPVHYESSHSPFYPANFYARNRIFDSLETTYGKYRVSFDMQQRWLVRRSLGDVYAIQTKMGWAGTINRPYFNLITSNDGPEVDDLLNVRYIIADRVLDSNFIFRDSVQQMILYERKNCYPRCYWKHQLGKQGMDIEAENETSIQQLVYSDDYQQWSVDCTTPDTLVFSENYYPGWKCYDNQKEVPIYKLSVLGYPPLFRGIILERGHHVVEFKYHKLFHWF